MDGLSVYKPQRTTSLHTLMFGDFDKDGIMNIDDPKPFNPNVKKMPMVNRNYKRYHTSQYADPETKLSTELMAIKHYNDSHAKALHHILRAGRHAVGRVKTVPSTIHKLRKKYIHHIGDVAAATHITKTRAEAFAARKRTRKHLESRGFRRITHRSDNYYKKPKNGHYGLHDTWDIHGRKVELQYKSRHMQQLDVKMHPHYKKKKIPPKFISMGHYLYRRGY